MTPPQGINAEEQIKSFLFHWVDSGIARREFSGVIAAARADERVTAWNEAIEAAIDTMRRRAAEPADVSYVRALKLPEAQPVERSEGEGT